MAKVRVHELAKELGITSKKLLEVLKASGEFVKSASSTIEAPVVRKAHEYLETHPELIEKKKKKKPAERGHAKPSREGGERRSAPQSRAGRGAANGQEGAEARADRSSRPAPKPASPGAAAAKPAPGPAAKGGSKASERNERKASDKSAHSEGKPRSAEQKKGRKAPVPTAPRPTAPKPSAPAAKSGRRDKKPSPPRPGRGPKPGAPRPGNNPFATSQGMPRQGGSGRQQGGGPRPRPGAPRPNPSMMPDRSSAQAPSRGNRSGGRGGEGAHVEEGAGDPAGGFTRSGGKSRGGSTAGAFGRQGGRPSRSRKSKRAKREEWESQASPMVAGVEVPRGDGSTVVRVRAGSSLADFAERIGADPAALITVLFRMGEMATVNQSLDEDTFKLLGAELGYDVQILSPEDEDREILESFDIDLEAEQAEEDDADLVPRPPVVTVMGHVDHGKTKLLDAIRHARVIETEAGGITQHIGAYQIRLDYEGEHRAITFIDTPGHEAFTQMRARGADVTDIAVLVVAADDGVMPQTIEAVNHAQAAGVKIIVAVNKIDVDGANPDKVRAQLTEYGIVTEEYGGDTMFVDISAKERTGIDDLLEAILYTADADLDLRANPDHDARGVAIEAKLDQGRGAVVTALVQTGTLRIGDSLVVGTAYGRVRAMFDETGAAVEEAEPSRPVQILGMSSVPSAGDSFLVASDDRTARQIADKREAAKRAATLARRRKRISLENLNDALKQGTVQTLNLIIKGDASGSVEALEGSLLELEVGDEVALQIIHRGVGAITQNDVNLATVDNAIIIGFNVRPAERVAEMADREGVEMKFYSVIYKAIEDVEAALKGMLKPVFEEVQLGRAEIRQVFRSGKFGNIAGSIVRSGAIRRGAKARLVRDGVVVAPDLEIASLRREKDDVTEVREGYECGITLGYKDIHEGDVIETFEMREKPRD